MVKDSLTNFVSNLKNASSAGLETTSLPYSKLTHAIADLLDKEGFIKNLSKKGKKDMRTIEVALIYNGGVEKIRGVVRVSKPSKRIYAGASQIPRVKEGFGLTIVSTSRGVMTDAQARKAGLGGEILFKIW